MNENNMPAGCARPLRGPNAAFIPNVVVETHDNRRAFFYDDLVRGKTVLIHCVATEDAGSSENLKIMANVQSQMGARLGQKVFIYSLALDPERDIPQALRALARKHGARD